MTQASTNDDDRINELEARLAQQDHSIIELSDEVYRQRLRQMNTSGLAAGEADEVPPHY